MHADLEICVNEAVPEASKGTQTDRLGLTAAVRRKRGQSIPFTSMITCRRGHFMKWVIDISIILAVRR